MTENHSDAATPATSPDARPRRRRTNPILLALMAIIPALAIAWMLYQVRVKKVVSDSRAINDPLVYNLVGRPGETRPLKLDDRFTDADNDLVADPPKDAAAFVDPPTINFSYVATNEPDLVRARFEEFRAHLEKEVGRKVEYVLFNTPEEEIRALHEGKLHVAGINTGNMPTAVNHCGFVPFCGLATEQGVASYQMQIIVAADSPIQRIADLKGRELTLTEPGSNSGFKAPLVLLAKDNDLQPGRDFRVRYSNGHRESIEGIANKTFVAAAVASDVLKRTMAEDPPLIVPTQFRRIYESENFPTAGFGYVWNLKPELAEKVKAAFTSFQWKGTGVEREFAASGQTKFVPLSFKNDFALVRRIDDAIRTIPGAAPTTDAAPTTESTQPTTTEPTPTTMRSPNATLRISG
jgi:phosphonate transport system substrate-binding protein